MRTQQTIKNISPGTIQGSIQVPPSKSISHRALIIAALSNRPAQVENMLMAEDTHHTLNALKVMGFELHAKGSKVHFKGFQQMPADKPVAIYVGNSGTTARLITGVAALQPFPITIDGTPRMRQRPMQPLFNALRELGIQVTDKNGMLPATILGGTIRTSQVHIDPRISSQFVSALMLIAPLLPEGLNIVLSYPPSSRSYIQLTLKLMEQWQVSGEWAENTLHIPPSSYVPPQKISVEGDFSSASYWLIGAHISGGRVFIPNISASSLQGDKEILAILKAAGAQVEETSDGITVTAGKSIHPIDWDMHHCPDLVPGVAVMCLFATGISTLRHVHHLQYKESDRIAAIIHNIEQLGGKAHYSRGDLTIEPRNLHGGTIDPFDDHRIAMAFALAGLRVPGIHITNPGCVAKSYPDFWDHLEALHSPVGGQA